MTRAPSKRLPEFSFRRTFPLVFVAVFLMHAPLLRLPFFWDEAGFYVPAAYDLVHSHSVIATTTLDTGHPPLSAAYLALWFTLSGWKPAVARVAMLLLAAFTLTNVFLLARRLAGTGVAVATTVATSVYPIFFVQSSLTHADLTAAAFTLWGIRLYIERRVPLSQLAFCLAVLSKETAIITPLAFALWEMLPVSGQGERGRLHRTALALIPLVPLMGWLAYHHHATGRFFGNADFYQYNVTQALSPLRFLLALVQRIWHLFGAMNMLALTAATAVAMFFPPVIDSSGDSAGDNSGERSRIAIPVQLQLALIMLAHLLAFSLLGGALLTRYLLPAYPLVIMIGMSTLRRRIGRWEWPAALMVMVFVLGLFFDPPYRFAPEDNLTYKDFVDLHYEAAKFLERHEQKSTILTAWPASDEISKPYLGYVAQSFSVAQVQDFTVEEMIKARQIRSQYQVAYLFSTKNDVPPWIHSDLWERLNRRFFGSHVDVSPELAAEFLHGKIVFLARRKAEWVAVLEMNQPSSVAAVNQKHEGPAIAH
ncbi:MAG TPA: glycosyltransferase family 39 protein [Candidatus Angelobacter sp.]|nr:glycosyltransferase family 39 protein [Candidatus Angelobacter sp.]